ncbi:MAG: hypothetical protein NXI01_08870 [Gammaproteobacteria bacterium]|nr:hypothetical protein [Gammaproteobacteria bacterium]
MASNILTFPSQELHIAFSQFQANPNYDTLFRLCDQTVRCQHGAGLSNHPHEEQLQNIIPTLQALYPRVYDQLGQFETAVLIQLSNEEKLNTATAQLKILAKKMRAHYKKTPLKIARAKEKYSAVEATKNSLNSILQYLEIQKHEKLLSFMREKISDLETNYTTAINNIDAIEAFVQSRSGEHLKNLVVMCATSESESLQEIGKRLATLYPVSLEQLELEQERELLNPDFLNPLKQKFANELNQLYASKKIPQNELSVMKSLYDFMDAPTWRHYLAYQKAKQNYPNDQNSDAQLVQLLAETEERLMVFLKNHLAPEPQPATERASETPIGHISQAILAYQDIRLANAFHEFQANTNEETAFALCEQIARCMHENEASSQCLRTIIPTIQRLFPHISTELEQSAQKASSHFETETSVLAFLDQKTQELIAENKRITVNAQASITKYKALHEKQDKLLSRLTKKKQGKKTFDLSDTEYNEALSAIKTEIETLKRQLQENKTLISHVLAFTKTKSQENLQRLREYSSKHHLDISNALSTYAPESQAPHERISIICL